MRTNWVVIVFVLGVSACSTARPPVATAPHPCVQQGLASWYRPGDHRSASGLSVSPDALIAAHRSLPFGTQVVVTDVETGRSVTVRIGDRGPFARGRIIDLSPAAAKRLGIRQEGVASVRLEIQKREQTNDGACLFDQTDHT